MAASLASITGCRKSLESTIVPSRSVLVADAAYASAAIGASCSPKGSATKWSRSVRTSYPRSSARRAVSASSAPERIDSPTTPKRKSLVMPRACTAIGGLAGRNPT